LWHLLLELEIGKLNTKKRIIIAIIAATVWNIKFERDMELPLGKEMQRYNKQNCKFKNSSILG